jgi:hypothetical protein
MMPDISDLFTECFTYIETLREGKEGCFLVRSVNDDVDIRRFRHSMDERTPRNMDESVHKAVNEHFLNIFKWPVRNGVFCFGVINPTNEIQDLGYGKSYLMFPCGEFEYVCDSEIFDLFGHYIEFFFFKRGAEISQFIGSINYTNTNLQYLMSQVSSDDRSSEIIINCQHYYLVNLRYVDELVNRIWHPV